MTFTTKAQPKKSELLFAALNRFFRWLTTAQSRLVTHNAGSHVRDGGDSSV